MRTVAGLDQNGSLTISCCHSRKPAHRLHGEIRRLRHKVERHVEVRSAVSDELCVQKLVPTSVRVEQRSEEPTEFLSTAQVAALGSSRRVVCWRLPPVARDVGARKAARAVPPRTVEDHRAHLRALEERYQRAPIQPVHVEELEDEPPAHSS
eukprot:2286511-Prymnesium_polylepis.1